MDQQRFTRLTRSLSSIPSRRHILTSLSGLGLGLGLSWLREETEARQRKKNNKRQRKKNRRKQEKKRREERRGRKRPVTQPVSPLPPPPPPPPPSGCTPICPGNACGADDGCGGTCGCAPGSVCHDGVCRLCSVTCAGDSATCGQELQAAIQAGGTIHVCPGRYAGNFQIITNNVELIGAGEGDDPAKDTILDGDRNGRTVVVGVDRVAQLRQLRITGGKTSQDGGGVRNDGTLTMTRCTVAGNEASLGGGISHNAAATGPLTIDGGAITGNTGGAGGGLACHSPKRADLNGCVISGNTSRTTGGGIDVAGAVTLTDVTVARNDAVDLGGGISTRGALRVDGATSITRNTASFGGGGISITAGAMTLNGTSITGNTAVAGPGGGIYRSGGSVTLNGAVVSGNVSDDCAGVMC